MDKPPSHPQYLQLQMPGPSSIRLLLANMNQLHPDQTLSSNTQTLRVLARDHFDSGHTLLIWCRKVKESMSHLSGTGCICFIDQGFSELLGILDILHT